MSSSAKRSHRFIDLTGQVFGRLTVVKEANGRRSRGAMWLCQCNCGKTTRVYGINLRQEFGTRSCGCLKTELARERIKNLALYPKNGPENHKWLGGCKNYGSIAYCRNLIRKAKETARERNYAPLDISSEELSQIILAHSGKCDLCGRAHESGRNLLVDHNHKTGKFRGLLCSSCNCIVVARCDNIPGFLEKLNKYIEK